MTVVFVVLILLGVLMEIVHLIDPTKKKKEAPAAATAPVTAPAAAPAAPSASAQNEEEVVAAIVGCHCGDGGIHLEQIASIRPTATSS